MKNPFKRKQSVASIMAGFTKARDQLVAHRREQEARIDALEEQIAALNATADAAAEESLEATNAILNLERFFVPSEDV
jgi:peptidoglycan hydrolase CwlO-like protein